MHRLLAVLTVCAALACRGRGASGGADAAATSGDASPAVPFAVRDDATELLFVWFDAQGGAHPARSVAEVPEARRQAVRVDPTRPEQRAPGWVYVADLRRRGVDGTERRGLRGAAQHRRWVAMGDGRLAVSLRCYN